VAECTRNKFTFVTAGATNLNKGYKIDSSVAIIDGVTAMTWYQFSGAGAQPTPSIENVLVYGGNNTQGNRIDGLPAPAGPTTAANKAYVDSKIAGLPIEDQLTSVRLVESTTTIDIAAGGTAMTIDGQAVVAGDRILLTDQAAPAQNGIYVAAAGAWTRATDLDQTAEATIDTWTFSEEGTTYGNTGWKISTAPAAINVNPMLWAMFSGTGVTTTPTLAQVMTSGNSAGSKKITNVTDGAAAQDAATFGQMGTADNLRVLKAGDTMTGALKFQASDPLFYGEIDKSDTNNAFTIKDTVRGMGGTLRAYEVSATQIMDGTLPGPFHQHTGSFAVSLWYKPTGLTDLMEFAVRDTDAQTNGYGIQLSGAAAGGTNPIKMGVRLSSGSRELRTVDTALTLNAWNHVAASWDAGAQECLVWVNGVAQTVGTAADAGIISATAGHIRICTTTAAAPGWVDDLRYYATNDTATGHFLTGANVAAIYKGGLGDETAVLTNLLAHYLCNEADNVGTTLADPVNTITLTSTAGNVRTTGVLGDPVQSTIIQVQDAPAEGYNGYSILGGASLWQRIVGKLIQFIGGSTIAMTINNTGQVGVGGSPVTSAKLTLVSENPAAVNPLKIRSHVGSSASYSISIAKSRGTEAAPADVQSGDYCGEVIIRGYYNGDYRAAGDIAWAVDAAPSGAGIVPSRLELYVVNTAGALVTPIVLKSDGSARLGDGATNYTKMASNGDQSFVGTAGFYPRVLNQNDKPAAGTGATQLDTGEFCIWIDANDSNRVYSCYNYSGTVKACEMGA
jgi:hypothetical protein